MITPPNHTLTMTDHSGKHIRGEVVYVQPATSRYHPDTGEMHIVTYDWLDAYGYEAVYRTPAQSVVGFYVVHRFKQVADAYLFVGTFTKAKNA